MPVLFLDLSDAPRVIDFLVMASAYAGKKERLEAERFVKGHHDGNDPPTEDLAAAARTLAIVTWPARHAVRYYLSHEGSEEEWKRVTAMVRPSTKVLMNRFRKGVGAKTLDEVLQHEDVGTALREDDEMFEVTHVRDQVAEDVWKEKHEALGLLVKDGVRGMEAYRERFRRLRDLAESLPVAAQDEVLSKMRHFEDRILFKGEQVPLEILDGEIAFYTEEKEIAPTDD
ncbi:hypothetical protein KJ781_00230 [Patescibacteria group bacterium]|nr:hypothetical protein [Patescibacteria group bacterium]MBU1448601.1 hypothetical protein [Patescibacteria group bacterium]MBU2613547.1 hypothetical protein [Patescibacteria group bacterium]